MTLMLTFIIRELSLVLTLFAVRESCSPEIRSVSGYLYWRDWPARHNLCHPVECAVGLQWPSAKFKFKLFKYENWSPCSQASWQAILASILSKFTSPRSQIIYLSNHANINVTLSDLMFYFSSWNELYIFSRYSKALALRPSATMSCRQ